MLPADRQALSTREGQGWPPPTRGRTEPMIDPTPSQSLQWAKSYARRGWSVVPMHTLNREGKCTCNHADCASPAKHPRVRWEQAMTERAGQGEIESWWARWPHANVAVATGPVSGLAVIDVDPRNDGEHTLALLQLEQGELPPTLESKTGGGGRHLWYALDGATMPSGELGPGAELKADRGLIVAPPSRHASGRRYEWIDYSVEPATLPRWVGSLVTPPAPKGASSHQAGPVRTESEQAEFREAWARVGVDLVAGDAHYICPFHDDHHPSLHIDAEGCRWFCFGCRKGGGTGRLLQELGIDRAPAPRSRKTGWVGGRGPATISGDNPVSVVGESFHQDELLSLAGGRRRFGGVELNAIAELVEVEGDGIEVRVDDRAVGFLSHEDANRYRDVVDDAIGFHGTATSRASIRGGWDRGGDDIGLFGVTLLLPETANDGSTEAHLDV